MQCKAIMRTNVKCAWLTETVEEAARRMRDEQIGFLPVCDEDGRVRGTVTDRDIAIRIVAEGQSLDTPVGSIMSREIVACRPEDDLRHAEELMGRRKVSRVLCTDGSGRVEGVLSLSDIAQVETGARAVITLRQITARESRL